MSTNYTARKRNGIKQDEQALMDRLWQDKEDQQNAKASETRSRRSSPSGELPLADRLWPGWNPNADNGYALPGKPRRSWAEEEEKTNKKSRTATSLSARNEAKNQDGTNERDGRYDRPDSEGGKKPPVQKIGKPVWEATVKTDLDANGEKPKPQYYVLGERPLEWKLGGVDAGSGLYQLAPVANHRQFIGNDGSNTGFTTTGVFTDKKENMSKYTYYNTKKYNAELIDAAIAEYKKDNTEKGKRLKEYNNNMKKSYFEDPRDEKYHNMHNEIFNKNAENQGRDYFAGVYDCQSFTDEIIERAEKLAKAQNKKLIVDEGQHPYSPESHTEVQDI